MAAEKTNCVLMWQEPDGSRRWDAVAKDKLENFLRWLVEDKHVEPSTIMFSVKPILWHWVFPDRHRGLRDVQFPTINDDIIPPESERPNLYEPPPVESKPVGPEDYYGWISPDGRYFHSGFTGHRDEAHRILGALESHPNPERELEELGWAKIYKPFDTSGKSMYALGMGLHQTLTDAQCTRLTRMGLSHIEGVSVFMGLDNLGL